MHSLESPFRLDPCVVERVWALLDKSSRQIDEIDPNAVDERPRIPTVEELETLLSAAFWASLMREEGRPVQFSLEFSPSALDEDATWTFAEPIRLSAKALVKIAPAFPTRFMELGVWPTPGDSGDLAIWGTARFSASQLRVRVLGPGRLTVHLVGGEKVVLSDSRLGVVASTRSGYWKRPSETQRQSADWEHSHALLAIAQGMFSHGHGGTILWAQSGSWNDSVKQPVYYRFRSPFIEARDSLAEVIAAKPQPGSNKKLGALLREMVSPESRYRTDRLNSACATIGTFTSIDGAVVLEHDFSVPAIGVKIQEVSLPPDFVDETDVFEDTGSEQRRVSELGGTRHASAVQFAYDQKGAVAIVASQDGIVSAVEWNPETERVLVTRHLELLFP